MPYFVILANKITDEQRDQIHAAVKEHAAGWWHHFLDSWIAGGHTAQFWRDTLKPAVVKGPASIVVLQLAEPAKWATFGPTKHAEWLYTNLSHEKPPAKGGDL